MSVTSWNGPTGTFGANAFDNNPQAGPSFFFCGTTLLDPRTFFTFQPGGATDKAFYNFGATSNLTVIDQVPSALSTTAIAAAQVPVANTPLTLVSTTGGGITVGQSVINPATGQTVSSLLAIDGAMGSVAFGTGVSAAGGPVNIWDPTKSIARNIQIASVGNDSAATAKVVGFDIYGFQMSETITLANATTATGKKAFKYVQSITPAGTLSGSNVSVGQGDKYGLPLRCDRLPYTSIWWNTVLNTGASGTFVAADTTSPATSITGDVRGTWLVPSASDGTKRLQVFITPAIANLATVTGLFGVTQA